MKLVSYLASGKPSFGILSGDSIIDLSHRMNGKYVDLKSLIADNDGLQIVKQYSQQPADYQIDDVTFLPVIPNPAKILCVGMNYAEKRKEFDETSSAPTMFVRFADSQTGHRTDVIKPAISNELDYEGELAVIIGKTAHNVKQEEALSYVAGYSCYMDGSIRDWQYSWFTAGKNWPSTGAFGPTLTTIDEIPQLDALEIATYLNGQQVQHDCLKNLIHSVPELIEYITTFTTLSPGDVILTGSPGGVGKKRNPPLFMKEGDTIEVEISHLGRLVNTIAVEKQ